MSRAVVILTRRRCASTFHGSLLLPEHESGYSLVGLYLHPAPSFRLNTSEYLLLKMPVSKMPVGNYLARAEQQREVPNVAHPRSHGQHGVSPKASVQQSNGMAGEQPIDDLKRMKTDLRMPVPRTNLVFGPRSTLQQHPQNVPQDTTVTRADSAARKVIDSSRHVEKTLTDIRHVLPDSMIPKAYGAPQPATSSTSITTMIAIEKRVTCLVRLLSRTCTD